MRFSRMITTIDTHTGGGPTRTVLSGIGPIPGASVKEKAAYLRDHADHLRTMILREPRGNRVMSAAILTEPCHPDADIGVIFAEVGGYLPMCGHDTIGCVTAIREAGLLPLRTPSEEIRLDTPAGLVTARIAEDASGVCGVTVRNVPAFVLERHVEVHLKDVGPVTVDIAYGGNVFALLDAAQVGVAVSRETADRLIDLGNRIRVAVNGARRASRPEVPSVGEVTHVEFTGAFAPQAKDATSAVVIPPGEIDRSPCGTGTSARLAVLHADGLVGLGEAIVHRGLLGTAFTARIVETCHVGRVPAVVVEITGRAYVTGFHRFVAEADDPLRDGFVLGEGPMA